jgi:hypothetical protein
MHLRYLSLATFVAVVSGAAPAAAQTPQPSSGSTWMANVSILVGYEVHRDHHRYEFENPSSFNTPTLVPHKFVQTYVASNQWFVGAVRYPALGSFMETEFGLTPSRPTFASDFDTFFNPDGDVIVSGTAGDVSMHSVRFAQWSEGRLWGVPIRVGYLYRRDVTEFGPADRLVTHSSPPASTRTPISTHETTYSQVHEVPIGTWREGALARRWRVVGGVDVTPLAQARLTTILPEKYPGQEIVFQANTAALAARLRVTWQRGRWPVAFTADYGRTWSYHASSQFSRNAVQVGVRVGWRP